MRGAGRSALEAAFAPEGNRCGVFLHMLPVYVTASVRIGRHSDAVNTALRRSGSRPERRVVGRRWWSRSWLTVVRNYPSGARLV
jgi:hypothetical protein